MRFKIGQEIVCIKKGRRWIDINNEFNRLPAPKYNDIVIVSKYLPFESYNGFAFISLVGYFDYYSEKHFAPILNDLIEIENVLKNSVEI